MKSKLEGQLPLKVGLVSLGCPKNLVDSEIILGLLSPERYRLTTRISEADAVIVNTCAFISDARRESRETIRKLKGLKKGKRRFLVVTGCLVQYHGVEAAAVLSEADFLCGVGEYDKIPEALDRFRKGKGSGKPFSPSPPRFSFRREYPRHISTPRHYAYLRIADGCDNRCRYCLIPRLRGPFRSRSRSSIVREAKALASRGVREVILVAQDTAYYGRAGKRRGGLAPLLEELAGISRLDWVRVLYAHPAHLDRRTLQTMAASDKICPYLDIPLQHINDRVLKKMGRKVTRARIERVLDLVREEVEGAALRTTLMVGFPGEGEREFEELLEFVRRQRFDHLGVFAYSPEEGTEAAGFRPRVKTETARARREKLLQAQRAISKERLKRFRGERIEILVDGPFPEAGSELLIGHSRFQAPEIDGLAVVEGKDIQPGDLVDLRVTDTSTYDLYGTVIQR